MSTARQSAAGRQAIIVLSDGGDTSSSLDEQAVLAQVQRVNIPIYSIGLLRPEFDGAIARRIAEQRSGVYPHYPD